MYTPNAVLLPTLSNSIANTEEVRLPGRVGGMQADHACEHTCSTN